MRLIHLRLNVSEMARIVPEVCSRTDVGLPGVLARLITGTYLPLWESVCLAPPRALLPDLVEQLPDFDVLRR